MSGSIHRITECGYEYTAKEQRFCAEYAVDLNPRRAALAATYSKKTAAAMASKLLSKPKIQALIRKIRRRDNRKRSLRRNNVLCKVAQSLNRNLLDLCDESGFVISDMRKIPRRAHAYIDGFEAKQRLNKDGNVVGQTLKFKLSPSAAVQDMGMRHVGGYAPDKQDVTARVNLNFDQLTTSHQQSSNPVEDQIKQIEQQE